MHLRDFEMGKHLTPLMLVVFVAACTFEADVPEGPPNWQHGYRDGCESGVYAAGYRRFPSTSFRKDHALYKSDAEYKQGWDEGYFECNRSSHVSSSSQHQEKAGAFANLPRPG